MNKIDPIIDDMEEYLDSCKPKAFSSNQIVVDRSQMQEFLDELRKKTPEEIKKYQKLVSNKEFIMQEAQEQADQMIKEAQDKIQKMVNEHDIVAQATAIADKIVMQAQEQADAILASANKDSDTIRVGAIEYTDSLLNNIESALNHTIEGSQVRFNNFIGVLQNSLSQVVANRNELHPGETESEDVQEEDSDTSEEEE